MTDFRFDLKAVRVKRVLAMFMAVCLTVLSVNVDVVAAADKIVLPTVNSYGYVGGEDFYNLVVTELNGDVITETKVVSGNSYTSPYSGKLKVEVAEDSFLTFTPATCEVSVLDGQISSRLPVVVTGNEKETKVKSEVKFTLSKIDGDKADLSITSPVSVYANVIQEAAPFVPKKSVSEIKADSNSDFVSHPNGDQTDKASKYNGITVPVSGANLVSQNYVNGVENATKTEGIVKVTFYNGIAAKNAPYGTAVAFATRAKGADMSVRAKADSLKAFETAYNQGKEFAGYDVHTLSVDKKGKVSISSNVVQSKVAYEAIKCNDNYAAVAVYTDKAKDADSANLNATMDVAVKQTATLQVAANDYSLVKGTDKSVKYEAVVQSVKAGKEIKLGSKKFAAGTELVANKAAAKHVINTVKYDAKAAVFTVKAGDTVTGAPAQVVINRVVTKVAKDAKTHKNLVETTPVATIHVSVLDKVAAPASITLKGLYGESFANVDFTTNKNQTIKVVATVEGSEALTKDVKFIAVDKEITTFTYTKAESAKLKTALKASSAVKVDKNGNITLKGAGNAKVYAYTQTKSKDGTVTLVVSNAFSVNVSKSTVAFNVVKDQKFKYNNAIAKKGTTPAVKANAYVPKKAQAVKYSVKGIVKGSTDYVAVKVLDKNGDVVLGGVTRVQVKKAGKTVDSDFDYQVSLKAKNLYTSNDNLYIVGTAQNGLQKVAKLTFAEK